MTYEWLDRGYLNEDLHDEPARVSRNGHTPRTAYRPSLPLQAHPPVPDSSRKLRMRLLVYSLYCIVPRGSGSTLSVFLTSVVSV